MNIALIHAPLDDPTVPYHSNAYLAGHLEQQGFSDVTLLDINAEFVAWCLREDTIMRFQAEAERRIEIAASLPELSFSQQEELYGLWLSKSYSVEAIRTAAGNLKSLDKFLDWHRYRSSVNIVNHYFAFIGALSYPGEIQNFHLSSQNRFSIYNSDDLFDEELRRKVCYPLDLYLSEELVHKKALVEADLIGVSIIYDHQVFYAMNLIAFIRKAWPEKTIIVGGTALSQYYKNLKNMRILERILSICDGIVVGEGETAICQIAASAGDFSGKDIRNLIYYDHELGRIVTPNMIHFENVRTLGRPKYQYDWDLYLSPERLINYSPTRGCYWNRCTFCDYGLNVDKPTSPWRERPVEQVIEDLRVACEENGVTFVYFAVDVMAPNYIERLAEAIIAAGLKIKWAAEMRMEKVFSKKRVARLAESGAVCISFGMESGSQRVLDLIDKGTKVEFMKETMKNFSEAGIAVQLMAFTDFPGETLEERERTHRFIADNQDNWSTGGLGKFVLTGKAIVARHPQKFGLKLLETKDVDTEVHVAYELEQDGDPEGDSQNMKGAHHLTFQESEGAKAKTPEGLLPKTLARPWAGATDTLHTMIFYAHFGRYFFRSHPLVTKPGEIADVATARLSIPGLLKESQLPIAAIVKNRIDFQVFAGHLRSEPREPTYKQFQKWSRECGSIVSESPSYWLGFSDKILKLDKLVFNLLKVTRDRCLSPISTTQLLGPERGEKVMKFLLDLEKEGLIEIYDPETYLPMQTRFETQAIATAY